MSYKPIFLLADSQLLFSRKDEQFFTCLLEGLKEAKDKGELKGAYIGASNGDNPDFYQIFVSACQTMDIHDYRMIPSVPSEEDNQYLDEADLILLAGGDIKKGWDIFVKNGFDKKIIDRYSDSTVLIGVSAGAVQLAQKGWNESQDELFPTFRLVPFIIDVHDEPEWKHLHKIVLKEGEYTKGIGISKGSGAILHPDGAVEAIKHPLTELAVLDNTIQESLILPPNFQL
ncbi:Type 1 glutamine amidotransferase-like domain-containing protein [Candidatus Parabeggiatoa sp. HSG14]|uniref:Type 1 glutamine amidotransferase-like domain-containing protein n=1 Tax=Candidatus Parabeggiatoa sp. HSG14 TaxID=3055593 RepID=UPI0025A89E47|nr:Type 1 glutamine amidotransferase-like domain-containing protein [Thiotrichales bacterium HSG14]